MSAAAASTSSFRPESIPGAILRGGNDVAVAVIPFVGEPPFSNSWALVEKVKGGSWGIGGKAFGHSDLRKIQEGEA